VADLLSWERLAPGGAVRAADAPHPRTGAWRTGSKPDVDLARCVNCLLCWLHCPDSAILLEGETFAGFDYDHCKGCEICAEVCPTGAIAMVPEEASADGD
jgi:2-oxoacid:acceptor oxidoreductase delta subunit (pyruvate/2-ketoisovalerate family)